MLAGIVVRGGSLQFGDLTVLSQFDLHVRRGQSLVVTGRNGSGKSTLLRLCAGLLPHTTGRVLLDGYLPDPARPSALFRRGVRRGFVFDNGGLLANQTALANVTLPLTYHADVLGLSAQEIDERARRALGEMQIAQADFHTLPAHLSLGLQKRVSVARALAMQPTFVYFDDPHAGLDASSVDLVEEILNRFHEDQTVTLMIATRDPARFDHLGLPMLEIASTCLVEPIR
jgi:ABC-type transporter Mla maintaining outer membrane lipid asymmetry ATPase subunit MlaF